MSAQLSIRVPEQSLEVIARPDVLVVGGGAAGIMAACAAAREGANVLLLEKQGFLGGTLTSVTLGGICGGYGHIDGGIRPVIGGLYAEFMERLAAAGALAKPRVYGFVHGVPYDSEALRCVADRFVSEHNVELLLHTQVTDVHVEDRQVKWVAVETRAGRAAIVPRVVIDTSGDADVVFRGGGGFQLGHQGQMQTPSTMFRMSGVDTEAFFALNRGEVDEIIRAAVEDGESLPRLSVAVYPNPVENIAHFNATRVLADDGSSFNLTDPWELTRAEITGRAQAYTYARVARERLPGFTDAKIVSIGAHLGVRETRLVHGETTLTESDVLQAVKPEDRIACAAWPIEDHASAGRTTWIPLEDGEWYGIPYGCLVSKDFTNVLVAGRCLSATHEAQASARVVAICMAMGEAAGIAAVMAQSEKVDVRVNVLNLQQKLRNAGAILDPDAED